jgi:hypothetical protein
VAQVINCSFGLREMREWDEMKKNPYALLFFWIRRMWGFWALNKSGTFSHFNWWWLKQTLGRDGTPQNFDDFANMGLKSPGVLVHLACTK